MAELTADQKAFLDSIPDKPAGSLTKEQAAFLDSIPTADDPGYISTDSPPKQQPDNRGVIEKILTPWADQQALTQPATPEEAASTLKGVKEGIQYAAPKLAGVAAGLAVPMSGPATLANLVRAGAMSGAAQGAAEEAVRQITGASPPSVTRLGTETAKGGAIGAAGGAVARAVAPVVSAGAELLAPGVDRLKRAATSLFRPSGLPPATARGAQRAADALSAEDARAVIRNATGEEVPIGVAEAIGRPDLAAKARWLAPGSEITTEDKDALKRVVLYTATQLRGHGVSAEDLGRGVVALLENEGVQMSQPARRAAQEAANELHPAIQNAYQEVQNAARAAVPGTAATHTSAGRDLRTAVQSGLGEVETAEDAAYAAARKVQDPNTIPVVPVAAKGWAAQTLSETPQAPGGDAVYSLISPEARKYVSGISDAERHWTLQQLLNVRSEVGRAIGNQDLLPGIGQGQLKKLYGALSQDVEASLNPATGVMPDDKALKAWQAAWAQTRNKAERFQGTPIEKIVDEFGAEGGAGPAAIAARLESAEAPQVLQTLRTAAGPTFTHQVNRTARELLFNRAAEAGRSPSGDISVAGIQRYIRGLAPEIQREFFPNLSAVEALARRETAIAGLTGKAKGILSNLSVEDPALLQQALGPTPSTGVMFRLQTAFKAEAQKQAAFRGSVVGKLKARDAEGVTEAVARSPETFVRQITDGTFGIENAREALNIIRTTDSRLHDAVQFDFVDQLLGVYRSKTGINSGILLSDLQSGTSTTVRKEIGDLTETVLGPAKFQSLKNMLGAFGELERQGGLLTVDNPLVDVGARAAGGIIGGAVGPYLHAGPLSMAYQANWFVKHAGPIRYSLASYMLTTPELRRLAMTPISQVSREQARDLMRGFSAFMIDKVQPGSPEAEDVKALAQQAER